MMNLYLTMILIAALVTLVFESGFWDNLDRWVNNKWKFYHLPHLLLCDLCQTWWLCLLYIIFSGNLSLLNIVIALAVAHLPQIFSPLFNIVKGYILKLIELMGRGLLDILNIRINVKTKKYDERRDIYTMYRMGEGFP